MNQDIFLAWALQWGVGAAALEDLRARLCVVPEMDFKGPVPPDRNEMFVQAQIRLAAPMAGYVLFRNNVGAFQDQRNAWVRYGLNNESKAQNQVAKSGDLIGYKRELITAEMVGQRIARFTSIECKEPGWQFTGTEHEKAQQRWANKINADGGIGVFSTGGLA